MNEKEIKNRIAEVGGLSQEEKESIKYEVITAARDIFGELADHFADILETVVEELDYPANENRTIREQIETNFDYKFVAYSESFEGIFGFYPTDKRRIYTNFIDDLCECFA